MKIYDSDVDGLKHHFIKNSKDFYEDVNYGDVDRKHHEIIGKAYGDIIGLNRSNFRNWSCQSDQGAPAQFMSGAGMVGKLIRPAIRKLLYRERENLLAQCFRDDIAIIESIGGAWLLKDNSVLSAPGVSEYAYIEGYCVNTRWLRYIYLAQRILSGDFLDNDTVWLDVGSYYGGLQGIIRKYKPNIKCILVDFHHQLLRSYIYLHTIYPQANHILPNEFSNFRSFKDLPSGSFAYLPASSFIRYSNQRIGFASNFFSFGEMKKNIMKTYMDSDIFNKADKSFLVNRFVSAPFFEPTYDTDLNVLDYIEKDRKKYYFDIFPIHHYLILERNLYGRTGCRNISSPYFELVTHI